MVFDTKSPSSSSLSRFLLYPSRWRARWNSEWTWKWDYLTVLFTLFLITFLPITSQIYFLIPFYPPFEHARYFAFHLTFGLSVLNLCINYYWAMFTHPGTVPPHWVPPWISNNSQKVQESEDDVVFLSGELVEVKKSTSKPRYCRTCQRYKPPRSHHCRQCGLCILKMDHHCPWLNNCIGHFNHAYFLRFLLYVDMSTSLCCFGLLHQLYFIILWNLPVPQSLLILLIIDLVLCIPTWCGVGLLSLFHFYYMVTNTTTIESMERDRQAYFILDGTTVHLENMYNVDLRTNLQTVFGPGPRWRWFFRGHASTSGCSFPYRLLEDDLPLSVLQSRAAGSAGKVE